MNCAGSFVSGADAPEQRRRDAGLRPDVVSGLVARAGSPDFDRWAAQVRRTGGCARPVHLAGSVEAINTTTGELHEYSTRSEAARALLVPCGSRHASRCRSCAATYRADLAHLIRAGLLGGKGRAVSVRGHPRVFVTLTAPSFGPVHTRRFDRGGRALPCRPRRRGERCGHGEDTSCRATHENGDAVLGMPLCVACFDYAGAVLWNAHAGALWRRFTIYLPRVLAEQSGVTVKELRAAVRVSFAKVAEFQRRGLVHFHAVIRLDDGDNPDAAPRPAYGTGELAAAVQAAVRRVSVQTPDGAAVAGYLCRFGAQLDVQPIPAASAEETAAGGERRVIGYLVKYATKSVDSAGGSTAGELAALDRRVNSGAEIRRLPVPVHYRAMIGTAWRLGALPELADLRLRRAAHQLGYRGPVMSRSRVYSTTLTALRGARQTYRAEQARRAGRDTFLGAIDDRDDIDVTAQWEYQRSGYRNVADAMLAHGIRDEMQARREAARDAASNDGKIDT